MKEFSFLRALCGVALLIVSAASAAEVCFDNLDNIVLEDPDTGDMQTYPVSPQDMPCTEGGNLVLPFSLAARGLTCSIVDPANNDQPIPDPIRVPLNATVPLTIRVAPTDIPVTNVAIADSASNCDNGSLGTVAVPTDHDCSVDADDVINASVTVSGTGVPGVICTYNIQPDALEIFDVDPDTQAVADGDNGDPITVRVRSVNPGTMIDNVVVRDSRLDPPNDVCDPLFANNVDDVGTAFSCDVENLGDAVGDTTIANGTFTATGTGALLDTAGYTLQQFGLVIMGVSPSSQVVNIGDTGSAVVSVRSNGGIVSNVGVGDSRGGSCTPVAGTTVNDTTDTDWNCTLAAIGGSSANGTLTASATGATSDNAGYTLDPTQLTVAITNAPSCIDPGNLSFDITVTHNNSATDVVSVPVTVSGTPAGECDQTLPNVPSTGSSYTCSFTPSSLPVSGSASTSSAEANDDSDSYNVTQCQGQLPAYCSLAEHNIVLAAGFISRATPLGSSQLDFWIGGAFWNSGAAAEDVPVPSNEYLALPFQPPGPGGNGGTVNFTEQSQIFWNVSISDCPGDFSQLRPFTSPPDTAIGTTQAGTNYCFGGGGAGGTWNLSWGMSAGEAPDGSSCILLQAGFTYYLNIVAATNPGGGGWVQQCSGTCTVTIEP